MNSERKKCWRSGHDRYPSSHRSAEITPPVIGTLDGFYVSFVWLHTSALNAALIGTESPYLGLLKLQVLAVLYGEVNVLENNVDPFIVGAVEGQETHHAVVIDLTKNSHVWFTFRTVHWCLCTIYKNGKRNQVMKYKHNMMQSFGTLTRSFAPLRVPYSPTYQTTDRFGELHELFAPQRDRAVLHHRIHVRI